MPMRPWANAVFLHRQATKGKEDPDANCTLPGVPRIDSVPKPFKILQSPDEVVILYEAFTTFRQVFTDGRALPEDPQPCLDGILRRQVGWRHAGGRNRRASTTLPGSITPARLTANPLHVTERFRRRDMGHLDIQITIDDPKTFLHPFTVHRTRAPASRTTLLEFICSENNKDLEHLVGIVMKTFLSAFILFCFRSRPSHAQWLNYPTKNAPRTKDGKPDMSAPLPRTKDGKPDITGIWMPNGLKYLINIAADLKPDEVPFQPGPRLCTRNAARTTAGTIPTIDACPRACRRKKPSRRHSRSCSFRARW